MKTNKFNYISNGNNNRMRKTESVILVLTFTTALVGLTKWGAQAIAPTIDYSHNMRVLKLPQSTPIGSLIYRLKGSDGDANSQLMFGLQGHEARGLLDVVPVQRSWNEADVYLRSKPEKTHYNFTLFVTDGNKTTQVESTILITDDEQQQQQQTLIGDHSNNSSNPTRNSLLPFLNTRHVFHVPENAKPNEQIGSVSVLESEKSDLPVRFELRGKGAERFAINYVFGPRGQSKGELVLGQELDYEKQNLFSLKVLALNAWTDSRYDTRNVATMDVVITVGDVQDSPPVFKNLPQSIRLPTDLKAGQVIYKCEAEDGDYADQRPIQYALDAGSPLASYFDIDKTSGEIRLAKSTGELLLHAAWQQQLQTTSLLLTVFASELPDASSYDHLWPPMYARVEIPLLLVDAHNEAPQFWGGWQTQERGGRSKTLHGFLPEWTPAMINQQQQQQQQQLVVRWLTNSSSSSPGSSSSDMSPLLEGLSKSLGNRPFVLDLGLGQNGTFELSLEGADAELFHLEPSGFPVSRQATFTLSVADGANKTLFDHEHNTKLSHLFTVDVVARDFGQPERLSSRIRCLIELVDTNDNWPKFDTDLYSFSVYENAPIGYLLGQVRARDPDSSTNSKVSYVSLSGLDSHLFHLNPENGQVTLEAHLDRERRSFYMFLVEARDSTSDHGLSNFTQLIINVLDVNDNAPVFLQPHYDAVLLSDGSFYQPLQVRALDADEPGTANSQVAYEIIAGNVNEQFSIDSVSGVIYPVASGKHHPASPYAPASALPPVGELPSSLKEPIAPHRKQPPPHSAINLDQAGKIKPTHEVEDAPRHLKTSRGPPEVGRQLDRQQQPQTTNRQQVDMPPLDVEQLPALDLLMSLETGAELARPPESLASSAASRGPNTQDQLGSHNVNNQFGPITTLVVRAHDLGIPLRSSTCKVNIFNQALQARSVSLILNGTVEQLDSKRDAIERAFSSLTGSRATIESLDALSDSSSLSVARVRLQVPEHSLVDLTDLSALTNAIEYRSSSGNQEAQAHNNLQPAFYYPQSSGGSGSGSSNYSASGNTHLGNNIFSDIHSYAIDSNAALERRLLIYIIIVGVCILALLVAWMIYYCCSRNDQTNQKQLISSQQQSIQSAATYRPTPGVAPAPTDAANKTHAKMAATEAANQHHGAGGRSPIANNLAKGRQPPDSRSMNNLLTPMAAAGSPTGNGVGSRLKPDGGNNNLSMYNGQVWFEPNHIGANQNQSIVSGGVDYFEPSRRASSAPSGGGLSLDSALHSVMQGGGGATWGPQYGTVRNARGEFFPNTVGYTRNVASMAADQPDAYSRMTGTQTTSRRIGHRRFGGASKVAPLPADYHQHRQAAKNGKTRQRGHSNGAFVDDEEPDLEAGRHHHQRRAHRKQSSLDSTGSTVTGGNEGDRSTEEVDELSMEAPASLSLPAATTEMSVELDSDQELLGFDSTGTPIIATHTRATSIKPIVVERSRIGSKSGPSASPASARLVSGGFQETSPEFAQVRSLQPDSSATREKLAAGTPDGAEADVVAGDEEKQLAAESKSTEATNETIAEPEDSESLDADATTGRADTDNQQQEETTGQSRAKAEGDASSASDKSTKGANKPQTSTAAAAAATAAALSAATNPLMSELSQRISSRKGSAEDGAKVVGADQSPATVLAASAATAGQTAATGSASTSASNKRQLMLKQGKTTKSLTRSQTRETTATTSDEDGRSQSSADTISLESSSRARELASIKNGELLAKKSIFAITYSGLATTDNRLPLAND